MEISSDFNTSVSDRVGYILKIIYRKFLGNDINDLVTGGYICLILVIDQLIDFFLSNFFIRLLPHNIPTGLQAFYMMAGYANIYLIYFQVGIGCITIFQCGLYCFDGFIDVQHLAMLNTTGIGFSEPKYFEFAEFILATGNYSDFGCSNVEADNNGLFVVHDIVVFSCLR